MTDFYLLKKIIFSKDLILFELRDVIMRSVT